MVYTNTTSFEPTIANGVCVNWNLWKCSSDFFQISKKCQSIFLYAHAIFLLANKKPMRAVMRNNYLFLFGLTQAAIQSQDKPMSPPHWVQFSSQTSGPCFPLGTHRDVRGESQGYKCCQLRCLCIKVTMLFWQKFYIYIFCKNVKDKVLFCKLLIVR